MTRARFATIALAFVLVVPSVAAAGPAIAAQPTDGVDEPAPAEHGDRHRVQDADRTEQDENETVRHRNPDRYAAEGDRDQLERWLEGRLQSRLEGSAIELSEGEAELAREHLDEEYRERLGQYVEVTGDEEKAETFEDAREEQERLVEAVDAYEEEKEAYERARESGDEERAREHARNLDRLWSDIDEASRELDSSYDAVSNETDADLSAADAAVDEVRESVETEQTAVREEHFLETELTLEPDDSNRSNVSFLEPLTATGELQTANGSAIANEEIYLEIGNATERVDTDSNGAFDLAYRPTTLPLETDALPVAFVPDCSRASARSPSRASPTADRGRVPVGFA